MASAICAVATPGVVVRLMSRREIFDLADHNRTHRQRLFFAKATSQNCEAPHLHSLARTLNFLPQIKQVTMYHWLRYELTNSQLGLIERKERVSLR
jgi:hypothetical protein